MFADKHFVQQFKGNCLPTNNLSQLCKQLCKQKNKKRDKMFADKQLC